MPVTFATVFSTPFVVFWISTLPPSCTRLSKPSLYSSSVVGSTTNALMPDRTSLIRPTGLPSRFTLPSTFSTCFVTCGTKNFVTARTNSVWYPKNRCSVYDCNTISVSSMFATRPHSVSSTVCTGTKNDVGGRNTPVTVVAGSILLLTVRHTSLIARCSMNSFAEDALRNTMDEFGLNSGMSKYWAILALARRWKGMSPMNWISATSSRLSIARNSGLSVSSQE